jgi:hypothetical protein
MSVTEVIRLIGPEFNDVEDDELSKWIELVQPMVSKKLFDDLYEQAVAYLVCHKLKIAGKGENPLGDIGSIGSLGFSIGSVSEGGTSVSFGASQSSNLANDAELALTTYGLQFLSIRKMVIIPIRCSGESQ